MTNTSPLEVKYKWYFLRRPPVRRQDPEQLDEGVDMQSECETDSLTEDGEETEEDGVSGESGEEEGEEEEEEEEGEEKGEEEESIGNLEGMEGGKESKDDVADEVEETVNTEIIVCEHSGRQSQSPHLTDKRGQSTDLEREHPTELSTDAAEGTATVSDEAQQDLAAIAGTTATDSISPGKDRSESTARAHREKQPWELVDDPFTLLRIEQVVHAHVYTIR